MFTGIVLLSLKIIELLQNQSRTVPTFTCTVVVRKLSLGPSKFWNYDPLITTRVHTQLNYKRKLGIDHAVIVNTGSRPIYAWGALRLARMENAWKMWILPDNESICLIFCPPKTFPLRDFDVVWLWHYVAILTWIYFLFKISCSTSSSANWRNDWYEWILNSRTYSAAIAPSPFRTDPEAHGDGRHHA